MAAKGRVLLLSTNLFWVPRVHDAASANGLGMRMATSEADFWQAYGEGNTSLVLVDLEGDRATWSSVVRGLKGRQKESVRIVAFGPHADAALLEEAKALGCDAVLSKNEFNRDLRKVLKPA